ncbi:ERF family protein [Bacillus badius]|uniref:ERF family protein n=1 Tax=Bacillus badius TaxID=1455 RepID=UPI001CBF8ACC|nr:ERF family protein [Bacillus badius]UAT29476.1 ERF family protein [Bacillus badius]
MKTSESINEIAKALAQFQSEVKQPEKDGTNPHFKSKYVTLDGTVKSIHECAPKHGLSYTQMPVSNESGVGVVTVIFHTSGQFIEFDPFILPLDKKTAQGVGSGLTYSKRYALSAAFGIVSDVDDDGNEATDNAPQNPPKQASSKQVGMIKAKVLEYAKLRGRTPQDVYKVLNITMTDLETLSSKDASDMIKTVDGWINKAKDEQQGA